MKHLLLGITLLFSLSFSNASQANDAHTQAVIDILEAIDTPNITRRAMMQSFASDTSGAVTEEFANCVNDSLSDDMMFDMFIPVYRSNLDEETALNLAEFFNSETGKKFAIIVRIQTGEDLPMPNMTGEDMRIYSEYESDILKLGSDQLVSDAEAAGMQVGMQLGMDCADFM